MSEWDFYYGLHTNRSPDLEHLLGKCWDSSEVLAVGPLRSKTRRKVTRVELRVSGDGRRPADFGEKVWFGCVKGIRNGLLDATVCLSPQAFQSVLTAFAADKVTTIALAADFDADGRPLHHFSVSGEPYKAEGDGA